MPVTLETYRSILNRLGADVRLVAVSKTKPVADIRELYAMGQRDFGENYVQELAEKKQELPEDINWHFTGHLQTNKVKQIISSVDLIHGVDSARLLKEIDRQAALKERVADVLLQVHIAREETKFGLDEAELAALMDEASGFGHVRIKGLMGMASNVPEQSVVRGEFRELRRLFDRSFPAGGILSMGMSADYLIAVEEGSNMVRLGTLLFGDRGQKH
jgi:hypothetical protein